MNRQYVILEGKNYDKLIEEGMQKLKAKKDEVKVELLETKKQLFSTIYKVKVSLKNASSSSSLNRIEKNIDNLFNTTEGIDYDPNFKLKQIDIEYKEDGVYLKINELATFEEIKEKIILRKIQGTNFDAIKQFIIDGVFTNPLKIAEPQVQEKINAKCYLNLSKDLMEAFVYVASPILGEDVKEDDIMECLRSGGVVQGINNDVIRKIARDKIYDKDVLVATGVYPQPGQDAELEYHFDVSTGRKVKIDAEGKIDFKELSLIKNVCKGEKLVTLIPDTKGTPGKNVLGIDVSARDGKKLPLPRGKNVEVTEDGLTLIAAIDGEVKLLDGKVSVFKVYEVPSDVDSSTGNIRFVGKVSVKGNVITGFEIEAEGDVEVFGVVEGAKITSKGNIILHRGIQGMNRGELYCEGDLIAKFIENSKIEAKGNVHSDAIMHSQVICGKKLEVTGRKGLLVGGTIKVAEEVKAKVIGSPMATVTEIEVGVNPDLRRKYEALKGELKQTQDNLEKTNQAVDLLTKISMKAELPEDKKVLLAKSTQLKLQLQNRIEQISSDMKSLEESFEEATKGKIKASEIVYPGSRIIIGSCMMYVKDPYKFVTFYRANAEVKIGPFEE
ncbi:MAG: FapA family protein [Bacillota bacterium]